MTARGRVAPIVFLALACALAAPRVAAWDRADTVEAHILHGHYVRALSPVSGKQVFHVFALLKNASARALRVVSVRCEFRLVRGEPHFVAGDKAMASRCRSHPPPPLLVPAGDSRSLRFTWDIALPQAVSDLLQSGVDTHHYKLALKVLPAGGQHADATSLRLVMDLDDGGELRSDYVILEPFLHVPRRYRPQEPVAYLAPRPSPP